MSIAFFTAAMISMLGVVITLFWGLFSMAKNGDAGGKKSNKLMQARVVLQGIAILFLLLAYIAK